MLARLGIRVVSSLVGILIGLVVSVVALSGFSATFSAILISTAVFWGVHVAVDFIVLRVLVRERSVVLAVLIALASTVVSLILVDIFVSGLKIHGVSTFLTAILVIWIATAVADMIGRRKIRAARRADRRG